MSYTRLKYHIVTATKCRQRLLLPDIERVVLDTIAQELEAMGGRCVIANGALDHVHILCEIPANLSVQDAVARLKSRSSRAARWQQPGFAWQSGFACFTVWEDDMNGLISYIAGQKTHHAVKETQAEWEWAA